MEDVEGLNSNLLREPATRVEDRALIVILIAKTLSVFGKNLIFALKVLTTKS